VVDAGGAREALLGWWMQGTRGRLCLGGGCRKSRVGAIKTPEWGLSRHQGYQDTMAYHQGYQDTMVLMQTCGSGLNRST